MHAPRLLRYELTQVAVTRVRKDPKRAAEILGRLEATLDPRRGLQLHDVHSVDVALLARATGLSAYDASYLWLAGWLEAELVTLDKKMGAASDPAEGGAAERT